MIHKLNDKVTVELRSGLTGWSVDTYTWTGFGGRVITQVYWSESEGDAKAFFFGVIAGAKAVELQKETAMNDEAMKADDREPDYRKAMLFHSDRADQYAAERDAAIARADAAEAKVEKLRGALDDLLDAITATDRHGDRKLTITGSTANLKWLLEAEEEARAALRTEMTLIDKAEALAAIKACTYAEQKLVEAQMKFKVGDKVRYVKTGDDAYRFDTGYEGGNVGEIIIAYFDGPCPYTVSFYMDKEAGYQALSCGESELELVE